MLLDSLFDWLLDGVPGVKGPVDIADRLGRDFAAAGIPVERLGVFVTTLHPNVVGRAFIWEKGKETRMAALTQQVKTSPDYVNSPLARCTETGKEFRWRKGEPDQGFQYLKDFEARGCVDYICFPLRFSNGEVHVMSVNSNAGFTDEHVAGMRQVVRALARVAEGFAMRRVAENILATYVGASSGARVMAGRIFKGDVETIHAAIWFSDLRGFTEMSSRRSAKEMICILNDVFECQVPAIDKHGGEVLKFIGDGLLAIFPIKERADAKERCEAAIQAGRESLAAMAALNAKDGSELRIGLALHVGDVEYGNIGGASRLDFTAIGAAVNTAARLEGIASKAGRAMVLSEDVMKLVTGAHAPAEAAEAFEDLGAFELKGISGTRRVFAAR